MGAGGILRRGRMMREQVLQRATAEHVRALFGSCFVHFFINLFFEAHISIHNCALIFSFVPLVRELPLVTNNLRQSILDNQDDVHIPLHPLLSLHCLNHHRHCLPMPS